MSERRKLSSDGGPNSKRSRNDDFGNTPSTFEEELALYETFGSDSEFSQQTQSQGSQESINGSISTSDIVIANKSRWSRPSLPAIDPSKDNLVFQQLDIENYVGMSSLHLGYFWISHQNINIVSLKWPTNVWALSCSTGSILT